MASDTTSAIVEGLIAKGPMPLAQLARRARNCKTGAAMLQNAAHYLAEAATTLAAGYWLGRARAVGPLSEALSEQLAKLTRRGASFGGWIGVLREAAAGTGGRALAALEQAPDDPRAWSELERTLAELQEELGADGTALASGWRKAQRRGCLGALEWLVMFRNKIYGHGTMLPEAVCRRLAPRMLAAVAQLLMLPALFDSAWLGRVSVDVLSEARTRYWKRLHGTSDQLVDPSAAPSTEDVAPHSLCFVRDQEVVPLSFVVIQDEDATGLSRFGFFQRAVGARGAQRDASKLKRLDYLDFLSGRFRHDGHLQAVQELARTLTDASASASARQEGGQSIPPESANERRFGDFVIERELGRGAMGIVYLATQSSLSRQVALKVLPPALKDDSVALGRFHREVRALGRCDHGNVVRIVTSGIDSDRPWYAMELVRGADLSRVAETLGRWQGKTSALIAGHLSAASSSHSTRQLRADDSDAGTPEPNEALPELTTLREGDLFVRLAELFADAADGLEQIHDRGLVHRDIKPANIMLTEDGERLIIMDLGLATATDMSTGYTRAGGSDFVGSARYAAPEQIQARLMDVDHRADIYSLGATLYELATLSTFYATDNIQELLRRKLNEPPTPARTLQPLIPLDLNTIIDKSLARHPSERYQHARNMARDLRAFAAGEPISARPPSPYHYLRLFYRRQRRLVWLCAASAALIIGLVIASFVLISQERAQAIRERDRAENLASFIADDLYERLEPIGRLQLLDDVNERIIEHHASRAESDPRATIGHAAALVRAAKVRTALGKLDEAHQIRERAIALLKAPLPKQLDSERRTWLSKALRRRGLAKHDRADETGAMQDFQAALATITEAKAWPTRADELVLQAADAHISIGLIHSRAERTSEAMAAYQQAKQLIDELLRRNAGSVPGRNLLVQALNSIGIQHRRAGRPKEALQSYLDAIAVLEKSHSQGNARTADERSMHAALLNNVAMLLKKTGRLQEARSYYERSSTMAERLVAEDPANVWQQSRLASRLINRGALDLDLGKLDEAVALFRRALQTRQTILALQPQQPEPLLKVAQAHIMVSIGLRFDGKHTEALDHAHEAVRTAADLIKRHGDTHRYQSTHAAMLVERAQALLLLSQTTTALADADHTIKLLEALDKPDSSDVYTLSYGYLTRGQILLAQKQPAEPILRKAIATAKQFLARNSNETLANSLLNECRVELAVALRATDPDSKEAKQLLESAHQQLTTMQQQGALPFDAKDVLQRATTLLSPP